MAMSLSENNEGTIILINRYSRNSACMFTNNNCAVISRGLMSAIASAL